MNWLISRYKFSFPLNDVHNWNSESLKLICIWKHLFSSLEYKSEFKITSENSFTIVLESKWKDIYRLISNSKNNIFDNNISFIYYISFFILIPFFVVYLFFFFATARAQPGSSRALGLFPGIPDNSDLSELKKNEICPPF